MQYVIIGGVAGGASTAARLRRLDEKAEIILFERGEYISYANCGLPYYIGDVIDEREKLFVQTPQSFAQRFRIDVRVLSEIVQINTEQKTVTVKKIDTGAHYEESFDKLILSPGAEPVRPPLEGIDNEGIFTLRNVVDTDRIKSYVDRKEVKRALIVGAGFIGLEMAENLHARGVEVTVVEMAAQVMTPVDYELAAVVHHHFKEKGVGLLLQEAVTAFHKETNGLLVTLKSGKSIATDVVILSIGVRPDASLARGAGLEVGETGGIRVNKYLQTSHPDIYAVGDAIEFPHPVSGRPALSFLAGPANKQARICADNVVFGNKHIYKGSIGTAIAKVFDLTVGTTGLSAKLLERLAIPYQEAIVHAGSHAGYYPGSIPLTIKINYTPDGGRLLGAQVVGYNGADKRLEMLAAVLRNGGTIYDLAELEHAYAPPYSSAKDPVNMVGFVADNQLSGKVNTVNWKTVQEMDKKQITLLDVRTPEEFRLGHMDQAVNISLNELRAHLNELPKELPVIVYCAVGLRGYIACRILLQEGFQAMNLSGGYKTYQLVMQKQNNELAAKPEVVKPTESQATIKKITVDACGLQCPGPVLKLKSSMEQLKTGEQLEISVTDNGFSKDVESWTKMTGNRLVSLNQHKGVITAVIEKGGGSCFVGMEQRGDNKTLIVFSDDLDRALASFVIANGAAATGRKVTMFFTFWGLNVIKKEHPGKVKKDLIGKMFGMMLPADSRKLSLSKMNMFGIGAWMMRRIMKSKKIDSLESLREQALASGVEFIACQMSMDVMGVKKEELLDRVEIGGVATYLERAEDANVNLFI